jgi:hypothetical protein
MFYSARDVGKLAIYCSLFSIINTIVISAILSEVYKIIVVFINFDFFEKM